jgi:hypothetical protein
MLHFKNKRNSFIFTLDNNSVSYNEKINREYYDKINNELAVTNMLKRNTIDIKNVCNNPDNIISEDKINQACSENPLALFSECIASECGLDRSSHSSYRNFIENKIVKTMKTVDKKVITYTSYYGGFLFQDIIILTKIGHLFDKIKVNFIVDFSEYFDIISDKSKNPYAESNKISFEFEDENKSRESWTKLLTYRIIKLLEWFNSLNINIKIRFYKSCKDLIKNCNNSKYLSDLIVGIDYIDQFYEFIYLFKICAQLTSNNDGYIFSLRTDGLYSKSYSIEIYKNKNQSIKMEIYDQKIMGLEKLVKNLNKNKLEIIVKEHDTKDFDTEIMKKNKLLKLKSKSYDKNGAYNVYKTDKCIEIEKRIESCNNIMYKYYDIESKKLQYVHNIVGIYMPIIWIAFYNIISYFGF